MLRTGAAYLESLRDGRQVLIGSERVKDVTTHPAFRNAVRSIHCAYELVEDRAADLDADAKLTATGTLAFKDTDLKDRPSVSSVEVRSITDSAGNLLDCSCGTSVLRLVT